MKTETRGQKMKNQQVCDRLADVHNWRAVRFDDLCGCYIRSLAGGDNATDWLPVTAAQIEIIYADGWRACCETCGCAVEGDGATDELCPACAVKGVNRNK